MARRPLADSAAFHGLREALLTTGTPCPRCDDCGRLVPPKDWAVHRAHWCPGPPPHDPEEKRMPLDEDTDQMIADIEALTERHARLAHEEQGREADRPVAKLEAIRRIMETPNALTGKPHSYSSAEAAVETDGAYAAYLRATRDLVLEKGLTWAKLDAARLRVRAIIAFAAAGGA